MGSYLGPVPATSGPFFSDVHGGQIEHLSLIHIYIMPHMVSDKTMGVYLAEPVADFIAVTFTAILFYFQFRKAMNKIES